MSTLNDYAHALNNIRTQLHDPRGSKVVVMVGAGFSRNAGDNFPTWKDLTHSLATRLYPNEAERENVINSVGEVSAALRLAQLFEVEFRRTALLELVRKVIPDELFEPSHIHRQLVRLPWSDILTTNFDTLLERADQGLATRGYSVVRSDGDLPVARGPRIIKLHGSLPGLEGLVLTEEDFRRYPKAHAPLVNTAQSLLAENICCLIGFSGDDPNFLAWSGWVRDELGEYSPNLYFFTDREPKPFVRRFLEARGILPIPLLDLAPKDSNHSLYFAYEWLFKTLSRSNDDGITTWNTPRKYIDFYGPKYSKEPSWPEDGKLLDTARTWHAHRLQYLDWYVAPIANWARLWLNTELFVDRIEDHFPKDLLLDEQLYVIHELLWRLDISLTPISDGLFDRVLSPLLERSKSNVAQNSRNSDLELSENQRKISIRYIRMQALRFARETSRDSLFKNICDDISHSESDTEEKHFVKHQEILWHIQSLRIAKAIEETRNWSTESGDRIWAYRRATLLMEYGLFEDADRLLKGILARVSHSVDAEIEIRTRSLQGLVLTALNFMSQVFGVPLQDDRMPHAMDTPPADGFVHSSTPKSYRLFAPAPAANAAPTPGNEAESRRDHLEGLGEIGCDPFDTLQRLRDISNAIPGLRNRTATNEALQALRFLDTSGIPARLVCSEGSNLTIADRLVLTSCETASGSLGRMELLGILTRHGEFSERLFSDTLLQQLTKEEVDFVFQQAAENLATITSIFETSATHTYLVTRASFASRVLRWLTGRLSDQQNMTLIQLVLRHLSDKWTRKSSQFIECLWEMEVRAMSSLSSSSQKSMIREVIGAPIYGDGSPPILSMKYIDLTDGLREESLQDVRLPSEAKKLLSSEIDKLLTIVSERTNAAGISAIHRLLFYRRLGWLSRENLASFTSALYQHCDANGVPTLRGYSRSLLLALPPPNGRSDKALFSNLLRKGDSPSEEDMEALYRATQDQYQAQSKEHRLINWTRAELDAIAANLEVWFEKKQPGLTDISKEYLSRGFHGLLNGWYKRVYETWIDAVEAFLHSPKVSRRDAGRVGSLLRRAEEMGLCTVQCDPALVQHGLQTEVEATRRIHMSLITSDESFVVQASSAISTWANFRTTSELTPIPLSVLENLAAVIAVCRTRHLALLIDTAAFVVEKLGLDCGKRFFDVLEIGLTSLLTETSYNSIRSQSDTFPRETWVAVRAKCAELSIQALRCGCDQMVYLDWIKVAKNDSFARVRNTVEGSSSTVELGE